MDGLCFDDLDEFARELDDPFAELEQDVVHGLLETFGSNVDAPTRGAGLAAALSGPSTRLPTIRARIESQLRDDARLTNATCAIEPGANRGEYRVDIVLQINEDELALAFVADSAGGIRRAS